MQWKAANKHVEKYWCLFTKVCRESPLAAPLPAGTGRRRLWQHVEIRLGHSGSITSSALRGLKWVQVAPRAVEGQKEEVERSCQVNTSGHQMGWHEEQPRSRSEDSGTLGWLGQEVSQAGENKSNWLRKSRMQLWNQSCWVTGYYLLWNVVMFGLGCEEGTKTR